ncbi:MAG: hypothetical protein M3O46_19125 [Myxococcota bacterium]|nr:hypothetical protein [Myxococcota bacterium]
MLQPSAWVGLYGVTASVWGSLMLVYEPPHNRFNLSAVEPSIEYTYVFFDRLKVEPSATYFDWSSDETPHSTVEASLKLSYKIEPFRLVIGNNVDLKVVPGAYLGVIGAEYERISHHWTISAALNAAWATADYNKAYFARDFLAFDFVEASISVRYDISDFFYFTVHAEGTTLVALTLQRSVQEPTLFNGGTAIGVDY